MTILDFFDIRNVDHLVAYDYLCNNGQWPDGFLSDDVDTVISLTDLNKLISSMAKEYVHLAIVGKIDGIPALDDLEEK